MIFFKEVLFALLFIFFVALSTAQPNKSLEKDVDRVILDALRAKSFPGCVVYASWRDSVIFHKSYGFHTYDSLITVRSGDLYDLASITKVTGATLALMKLYEDGYIHLDDPIGRYISGLGKKVGAVTFRACLSHQAGLHPWIPFYQKIKRKNGRFKPNTVGPKSKDFDFAMTDSLYLHKDFYQRIKKWIRRSEVTKDPVYQYSGLFFYLVPELVETLSGVTLDQFLNKHFFNPLGAETVVFNPLAQFDQSRIVPTENDTYFRMEQIHGMVHDEGAITMRGISGNAGLFGNAADLTRIWQMFLNGGTYEDRRYLKPETLALFTTAQFPNLKNRRGLGFDKPLLEYDSVKSSVAKSASYLSYGHSGFTGTLVWADPAHELLFIFLSYRVHPTRENRALYELNVRPTIHQLLYESIYQKKEE
ncbi:MAG: serine hydrolase [Bacteroidota bacterium]